MSKIIAISAWDEEAVRQQVNTTEQACPCLITGLYILYTMTHDIIHTHRHPIIFCTVFTVMLCLYCTVQEDNTCTFCSQHTYLVLNYVLIIRKYEYSLLTNYLLYPACIWSRCNGIYQVFVPVLHPLFGHGRLGFYAKIPLIFATFQILPYMICIRCQDKIILTL